MIHRIRKLLIALIVFLCTGIVLLYLFRNLLLESSLRNFQAAFKQKYHADFFYSSASLTGLTRLSVTGIRLTSPSGDSLLSVDSVNISINPLSVLINTPLIREFDVYDASVSLFRTGGRDNFTFLLKGNEKKRDKSAASQKNYASAAGRMLDMVFEKVPLVISFHHTKFTYSEDSVSVTIELPELNFRDSHFEAVITEKNNRWLAGGVLDRKNNNIKLSLTGERGYAVTLPYLQQKYGAIMSFDTLKLALSVEEKKDQLLKLTGESSFSNLKVNHWRISPVDVTFRDIRFFCNLKVGDDWFEMDSTSSVNIGDMNLISYARFRLKPEKEITLKLKFDSLPADNFFGSLPTGIFRTIEGIKTEGQLSFHLDFFFNTSIPDSLRFSSVLSKEKFKIIDFGEIYFPKINQSFEYTAYEKGVAVRTFLVGPENPDYTPIGQISTALKNSVLTSEDGGFFWHRGFNEDAFREAITTNIKEKRFVRGGSTITMQLVKNVFLNRNKTVARKLEEAIIVWLIENNSLSTKERMFEVYLNVIEWGPGVYGIGEASEFYFSKKPSDLTLAESIFLASIIPHPKWFRYSFDKEGKLKPYLEGYYRLLAGIMLRRQQITEEEAGALKAEVFLKGPARGMIVLTDSVPSDSLMIENINRLEKESGKEIN